VVRQRDATRLARDAVVERPGMGAYRTDIGYRHSGLISRLSFMYSTRAEVTFGAAHLAAEPGAARGTQHQGEQDPADPADERRQCEWSAGSDPGGDPDR
jgi:hypothetical protein